MPPTGHPRVVPPPPPPLHRSRVGSLTTHSWERCVAEGHSAPGAITLSFLHHGLGDLEVEGRRTLVDPSQVLLLRPGTPFRVRHRGCTGGPCATTVSLSPKVLGSERAFERAERAVLRRLGAGRAAVRCTEIQKRAQILFLKSRPAAAASPQELDDRLLDLFRQVARRMASADAVPAGSRSEVRRVRLALSGRLEEPPALEELADGIGCSRFHLCRVFKEETGLTIRQYVHRLRLSEAVLRMAGDDAAEGDLAALAADLGYASHSHFTSRFRRFYGVTPSRFRNLLDAEAG